MFHKPCPLPRTLPAALLALLLSGCMRTELLPPPLNPGTLKLASLAKKPVALMVDPHTLDSRFRSAGHQYLFLIIPFGSIRLADLERSIYHSAYSILALHNYRPLLSISAQEPPAPAVPAPRPHGPPPHLTISVSDISISAWDFLFFRRISSRILIEVKLQEPAANSILHASGEGLSSSFRKFAFREQLEQEFNEALSEALVDAFASLGIVS